MPNVDPMIKDTVASTVGTSGDRASSADDRGATSDDPARPSYRSRPARGAIGQLGVDARYVLTSFPLALVGFVLVVTGVALGAGLAITLIGFPILAGVLYLARGLASIERYRIAAVLDEEPPVARYLPQDPEAGWLRRITTPLRDGQYWLDVGHAVVGFPVVVLTWAIGLAWSSAALAGLGTVFYDWAVSRDGDQDLLELLGFESSTLRRILLYAAVGLFFALTLPFVMRACAKAQALLSRAMLTGLGQSRARIATLTVGRAAAVSAEATALRRLERDIHDGPQQRLVRLAMDIGRAQRQLDSDPEAAHQTLSEAFDQTRDTLDELRALSRGIAPPILADRGLSSALAALAARSTVPVELFLDLPEGQRLPDAVENTIYFVVAESLANVAKHSAANAANVYLRRDGDLIQVAISDNGRGGAVAAIGHGLAGLADRLRSVDGELIVHSPFGGPTVISANVPSAEAAGSPGPPGSP